MYSKYLANILPKYLSFITQPPRTKVTYAQVGGTLSLRSTAISAATAGARE